MASEKERVSVTLTKPYLNFLEQVVKNGIYIKRGEALREGLRLLMRTMGVRLSPEEAVGW